MVLLVYTHLVSFINDHEMLTVLLFLTVRLRLRKTNEVSGREGSDTFEKQTL